LEHAQASFQASTTMQTKSAIFWEIMHHRVAILYWHFWTAYQSQNVSMDLPLYTA